MNTAAPRPELTDRQLLLADCLIRDPRATLHKLSRSTGMTRGEVVHETALLAANLGVLGAGRAALVDALKHEVVA